MDCPDCGAATLSVPLSDADRERLPEDAPGVAVCTRCLRVDPITDPPADCPDLSSISDAFPPAPEHARTVICLLALLDQIALYRGDIDALVERAEAEGTDVMLVLDRLAADERVAPHFDLEKRTHQLRQLLR